EMPLEHVEAIKDMIETLIARDRISVLQFRAKTAEHLITELLDSRDADRLEMAELQSRARDVEPRLWPIKRLLGLL
ncbi:hypothetical protein Tco_1214610, partial [Tanacetum coccineum]